MCDDHDRSLETVAQLENEIVAQARGSNGFGYDPHFRLPGLGRTSAELEPEHKNRISHRGIAMRALVTALREQWAWG